MSDRLNRILSLSKKTGDTVIINDPTADRDLVVLPFDHYENLVSSQAEDCVEYDEYLLEEMSERELIDKINRDIAVWRSYQELNERERQASLLEDQLTEEPLSDPFEEDFSHRSDWHKVSDLFGERYKKIKHEEVSQEEDDSSEPIQTYTPIQDESRLSYPQTHILEDSLHPPTVLAHTEDSPEVFGEESGLDSEESPVFLEEPST